MWRRNKVLRVLAGSVEKKRVKFNSRTAVKEQQVRKPIEFVREGVRRQAGEQTRCTRSFLEEAQDWQLMVDLDGQLKIPEEIVLTRHRPDMVLISKSLKKMVVVELTVPMECRIEVSNELKKKRYADLEEAVKPQGWKAIVYAVEVGCRGFPASSMASVLKAVGCSSREKREVLKALGAQAEQASATLWKMSHVSEWGGARE